MYVQNPEVVALKEDIRRTKGRLNLWERELEERNKSLAAQHSKVAKLQADLDKVVDGMIAVTAGQRGEVFAEALECDTGLNHSIVMHKL